MSGQLIDSVKSIVGTRAVAAEVQEALLIIGVKPNQLMQIILDSRRVKGILQMYDVDALRGTDTCRI